MPIQVFSNNAQSTLASTLLIGGTSMVCAGGEGGLFQAPNNQQFELVTLTDGVNLETVVCTARTADTFTITRAFEGVAREWPAGTVMDARLTAESARRLQRAQTYYDYGAQTGALSIDLGLAETIRVLVTGDLTVTFDTTNAAVGYLSRIWFVQDTTGNRLVDVTSVPKWMHGAVPYIKDPANMLSIVSLQYIETTVGVFEPVGVGYAMKIWGP